MENVIKGRAYKFGDNIDTDVIAPGMTISFGMADKSEMDDVKTHAFNQVRPDFYKEVVPGSILIAGRNFGFGSHREQASTVVEDLGFRIVLADSVSRLYKRNSFAIGFPALDAPGITQMVEEGDELEVDLNNYTVKNLSNGAQVKLQPFSGILKKMLETGGIIEYMREKLES